MPMMPLEDWDLRQLIEARAECFIKNVRAHDVVPKENLLKELARLQDWVSQLRPLDRSYSSWRGP